MPGYYDGGTQDTVRDVEITEWLKQAAATSDAPKRKQLYEQVDSKIIDQAYWIPLFVQNVNYGFSKDFDFHPWPDEDPRFYLTKWK